MLLRGPLSLPTPSDTEALAARLAGRLGPGDTVLLAGPVGSGKSALARALIRTRFSNPSLEVPSPTFTLVQTYGEGAETLWHADLYRLSHPSEVAELGLLGAMEDAICLIEWPDRLGPLAPARALRIDLVPDGDGRAAVLTGQPSWTSRVEDLR